MSERKPGILPETPSQTAGPYVHIGLMPNACGIRGVHDSDPGASQVADSNGKAMEIRGRIFDGDVQAVLDAVIETWQADSHGSYGHGKNSGWQRIQTDGETGEFSLKTTMPGPVPLGDGRVQAPHVTFWIIARGINLGLHTRMYFDDQAEANAADPLLQAISPASRRNTLVASALGEGTWEFNIHLQGESETVFLDI